MNNKFSIDVSIYPPNSWRNEFLIYANGKKNLEVRVNSLSVEKLMAQMYGIEYEIHEKSISIHGWIPGPEKR